MAYTPNTYTTDGSVRDFNITFPFLRESDVRVTVFDSAGNELSNTADYDVAIQKPDQTFQIRVVQYGTIGDLGGGTALASGNTVTIERVTDISTLITVFQDGASLRAEDINALITQINYALEEFGQNTTSALGKNVTQTAWDATSLRITNLAQPTADNDAIRKVDVDSGIGPDITTVAGIAGNVTTVANDEADIGTVAADLGGSDTIGTVAGISSAVSTVAGISSAVTGVNTISGNVTIVANDEADIGTVAADLSGSDNIGTVATNIANVNALAPQASNIGTLTQSANLTALQNAQANAQAAQAALAAFENKYHGTHTNVAGNDAEVLADIAGDSALTLEEGDLYFDSTNDRLRVYDGSAWHNAASVNVINATTLAAVGDVAAYSNITQNDFIVRGATEWENATPTAARTALGLGTAATTDATAYATALQGTKADDALQPGDVVNDVTTGGTLVPLSAQQGVALQSGIDGKIANVADDATPQLGGNLDVNGNSIVSVSGGNIPITPSGAGKVILDGLSWPTADGTANQLLKTDGAGNLSFADAAGGAPAIIHDSEDTTLNPYLHVIAGGGDFSIVTRNVTIPAGVTRAYIWAIGAGGTGGDARGSDAGSTAIGGPGGNGSVGLAKIVDLDLLTSLTNLYCKVNATGTAFVRLNNSTGTEIATGNPGVDGGGITTSGRQMGRNGAAGATPLGGNVTHAGSGAATFSEVTTVVGQPSLGHWNGAGRFVPRNTGPHNPANTTGAQTLSQNVAIPFHYASPLEGLVPSDTFLTATHSYGNSLNVNAPARLISEIGLGGIPAFSLNQTTQLTGGTGGPAGIVVLFQ